jgi:kynurenine formamidase
METKNMFLDLTLAIDMNDPVVGKANQDQNSFMSQGHIGTHLDVYEGQGRPPAEYAVRRGIIVKVGEVGETEITEKVLEGYDVREGDFVIFHTGYLSKYSYGTRDYFRGHPQMSWDFVETLAKMNLGFIGLDFAGLRRGDEHGPADVLVGRHGGFIVENMNRIGELYEAVGKNEFKMHTGWTGLLGFSGLSCRVVAEIPDTVQ